MNTKLAEHQKHSHEKNSTLIQWLTFGMEAVWLLLVFLLPLIFFPNIFTTFELAKIVVFEGATVLLLLMFIGKYFLMGKSPSFDWDKYWYLWLSLLAFLGLYIIATIFSVAPALSFLGWYPRFQGLFTMVSYLIFGTVIFFELKSPQQRERLIITLMVGFFAVSGIAMSQKFLPGFLQWWNDSGFNGRIYGTMANPNYLASYIVMMIPLFIVNIFRKKFKIFSWIGLVVGISALLLTLSRAGFLAFFLSVLFLLVVVAVQRKAKKTLVILCLLPFLAGGFVWFVLANSQQTWIQNIPFVDRLTSSEENASSARERLEVWPAVLKQISVSPIVGFGPETFAVTFASFAPPTVNTREDQGEILDHVHNELLDWAVQIGVPGMIAYLCLILGLIVQGWKKKNNWWVLGFSSSILGLFIANQFGFSVTVQWVFLTLFAAVMLNILHQEDKGFSLVELGLGTFAKIGIFAVIAVLSVSFFWVHGVQMVQADAEMRNAYDGILELNSMVQNSGTADGSQIGELPQDDPNVNTLLAEVASHYKAAVKLAPAEPFFALNSAFAQLQWLYEGQKVSSVEISEAINNAFHAARLRGYDSFSVSVAREIGNGF